ncbi:hypothetical protein QTH91_12570 [Variovorax dokdonensis]|uniref:Uncharacterized protein n=1 Tax=Variovorax dokdonensis TaxID=344883 RepID=A0ABT7NBL9_9BURK|nr:hypothetical protein [Variovorax dokdonensis]MDM0045321.1 hypothetical protein [Variovorax dokdonensis]
MNAILRTTCASALLAVGSLAMLPAHAQKNQFQAERATCDGVMQDKQACLREAGAAAQASSRGNLTHASPDVYRQNALARCSAQPPADKLACEQRVLGTGDTTIEGSVMGGGAIRETVTTVPLTSVTPTSGMPPPRPMPPPATMPPARTYNTMPAPAVSPPPPPMPMQSAPIAPMTPATPR